MYVFPAIDVLCGKAVRLLQGDYDRVTVYHDDIVAQAAVWVEQGAEWIHMVDLDGARTGEPINIDAIAAVAATYPDLRIQVGGGIRTRETAQRLLDAGVTRVILGTALVKDTALVREMVTTFGDERLVAGVDARDGMVAVEGWREGSAVAATELVDTLRDLGLKHLVFTDISRDGAQTGIDAAAYRSVAATAGFPVIVSGGVTTLDDIAAAGTLGTRVAEGVIVGRALYEKNFTLTEAIETLARAT
ncbi:MAG: 1-(5-phosphoribosyl)-5-[(5-phosphoribosylamino)methylideneamino]imidazole-4-carboxamide isomerase [Coriobacteriia bacterium]|nr:1-(5-phosphoribosyl)-5-[(5-phosphoribosylamino)methylideneamino]imidazole-4-carboxamide isomerase [Coriobacteriia bacterium]